MVYILLVRGYPLFGYSLCLEYVVLLVQGFSWWDFLADFGSGVLSGSVFEAALKI